LAVNLRRTEMTKLLSQYETVEGAIAYLERMIEAGVVPPVAGARGLVRLRAESARIFALLSQ
jgi:hypothetical protein